VGSKEHPIASAPGEDGAEMASRVLMSRSKIVGAVRSPLGFFTLALLIVEGFLLGAGAFFELDRPMRITLIWVGIGLFLVVFAAVYRLVVKYPKNLVFTEESHIQFAAMKVYGESRAPVTGLELVAKAASAALPAPTNQPPAISMDPGSNSPEEKN